MRIKENPEIIYDDKTWSANKIEDTRIKSFQCVQKLTLRQELCVVQISGVWVHDHGRIVSLQHRRLTHSKACVSAV